MNRWTILLFVAAAVIVGCKAKVKDKATSRVSGELEQRKQKIIDLRASSPIREGDPLFDSYEVEAANSLARLAKGVDLAGANDYFGKWGPTRDRSQNHDNFTYTYWIRAYFLYKDTDRLTAAAKTRMLAKIGKQWRNYWPTSTENHSMAHGSNIYLARQLYGDDLGRIRSWLIDRFTGKARKGWREFNSPCYINISMMGIWNLADFAEDPVIKTLATMTLDWLLAEFAAESLNVRRGGPFHRGYMGQLDRQNGISGMVFFGQGRSMHAALTNYRPPKVIVDIALDKAGRGAYVLKARRPKGDIYYYVTPEFVLACAQNAGRLRKIGTGGVEGNRYGDQRWNLSFGSDPKAVIHSESEGKPCQYKNILVINTRGKPLKYAVLLGRDFKINQTDGKWRFIREGGTFAAIHSRGSLHLLEVRQARDYGSFTDFKNDIKNNPLAGSDPYVYTSTLSETIEFKSSAQHITKVNGAKYSTSGYKLFDSPFVNSDYDSGYVVIRKGGKQLILDFRDRKNPKREIGTAP